MPEGEVLCFEDLSNASDLDDVYNIDVEDCVLKLVRHLLF